MIGRIRDRSSFERLRREGTRSRIDPLWCSYLPDPTVVPPQVAFALGRSIGHAVARNRLRRRLRAVLADSDVPAGLLLVGADPAATELTFDVLRTTTRQLLDAARRQAPS